MGLELNPEEYRRKTKPNTKTDTNLTAALVLGVLGAIQVLHNALFVGIWPPHTPS